MKNIKFSIILKYSDEAGEHTVFADAKSAEDAIAEVARLGRYVEKQKKIQSNVINEESENNGDN